MGAMTVWLSHNYVAAVFMVNWAQNACLPSSHSPKAQVSTIKINHMSESLKLLIVACGVCVVILWLLQYDFPNYRYHKSCAAKF